MSESDATRVYLHTHFLRIEDMAHVGGTTPARLRELIDACLVPAPSYMVRDAELVSAAFGPLPCAGLVAGDYMHREMSGSIRAALDALREHGEDGAAAALRESFATGMRTALLALQRDGVQAPGCFDADGGTDDKALAALIDSQWKAHLQGIFGVCVRHPGNLAAIAEKETSQALLGQLTDSGARREYSAGEAVVLRSLIARYAQACSSFAPPEYPRSSRKRYLEDLPKQLPG